MILMVKTDKEIDKLDKQKKEDKDEKEQSREVGSPDRSPAHRGFAPRRRMSDQRRSWAVNVACWPM